MAAIFCAGWVCGGMWGHEWRGILALQWRHNERDGVYNHQPHDCLLNRLFRHRSKKTSKLRVTGLCVGNSQVTREFPVQQASNAENASAWWRHHEHWEPTAVMIGPFATTVEMPLRMCWAMHCGIEEAQTNHTTCFSWPIAYHNELTMV